MRRTLAPKLAVFAATLALPALALAQSAGDAPAPDAAQPSAAPATPSADAPATAPASGDQSAPAASPEAPKPVSFPGVLTSVGQCCGYGTTNAVCLSLGAALLWLPIPGTTLCPWLCAPGAAACVSTMSGDFLSGDRHPLLYAMLASYASVGLIGIAAAIANVGIGAALYLLATAAVNSGNEWLRAEYEARGGKAGPLIEFLISADGTEQVKARIAQGGAPVLALGAVLGVVDVLAFAALWIIPPVLTTVVQSVLRREPEPLNKLPRLVDAATPRAPAAPATHALPAPQPVATRSAALAY